MKSVVDLNATMPKGLRSSSMNFQGCFQGASRKFQGCYVLCFERVLRVWKMFQVSRGLGSFMRITKKFHGCFRKFYVVSKSSKKLLACFNRVHRIMVYKEIFKEMLRKFQGCFKEDTRKAKIWFPKDLFLRLPLHHLVSSFGLTPLPPTLMM